MNSIYGLVFRNCVEGPWTAARMKCSCPKHSWKMLHSARTLSHAVTHLHQNSEDIESSHTRTHARQTSPLPLSGTVFIITTITWPTEVHRRESLLDNQSETSFKLRPTDCHVGRLWRDASPARNPIERRPWLFFPNMIFAYNNKAEEWRV